MPKAYWVNAYRAINDRDAMRAYSELAGPAILAAGGRFLVRGTAAKSYESGLLERVVVIEFDSLERALAAHETDAYQAALRALGNGADRDVRIVEGVD